MKITSPRHPLLLSALLCVPSLLAGTAHAATLYTANGFESFTAGALAGQGSFARFGDPGPQFTVGATSGVGGTRGVAASGEGMAFAYVALNYTPPAGTLVNAAISVAASDPAASAVDANGYFLVTFDSAGNTLANVGLRYTNNTINAVSQTRTGSFTVLSLTVTPGAFVPLETRLNFALKTFDVYSGTTLLLANSPFITTSPTTVFGDADLFIDAPTGAQTTGFFDNYVVSTSAVPEPSTLAMLGLGVVSLGMTLRHRRRRRAAARPV